MLKKTRLVLFFLWIVSFSNAQSEKFIFKNYDTQNGISDNSINSIIDDDHGFIWIGTREGLCRFDGAEFKVFNFNDANHSLNDNYTWMVNFGNEKILLLKNSKLALLNTSNLTLKIVEKFKAITIFEIDKIDANLFALNLGSHIILVDDQLQIVDDIKIKDKIYIALTIHKFSKNKFIIGNCYDYYLYDLITKKQSKFNLNTRILENKPLNTFAIKYIDETAKNIYISDYFTGLYIFNYEGKLLKHFNQTDKNNRISSTNILAVLKNNDNSIWLATDIGINILSDSKTKIINHEEGNYLSIKSDIITTFHLDKNNNIWIGTNQGISVFKNNLNNKVRKINIPNNPSEIVAGIAFNQNDLYAGIYLDKTYKINTKTKEINALNNTPGAWNVKNIDHQIVISGASTNKEIVSYNPISNQYYHDDFLKKYFKNTDIITLLFKHSNGDMWYSGNAGGGFVIKRANSNTIEHIIKDKNGKQLLPSSYYTEACEDAEHNLWFSVNRSHLLLQWNIKTNSFTTIDFNARKENKKNVNGGITSLKIDSFNNLWVAYEGAGIIKFNPKKNAVFHYTIENGLISNYINNIELDTKNRLWILSNKGISCLDINTNKFYIMDVWDGFIDNPINYNLLKMDSKKNIMWIGALGCLYSFNPDNILKNKKSSTKIFLDNIKINNKENVAITTKKVAFKPNENNLEFNIVAVDIENGKNLVYGYKLEGFNNQWIDIETNKTILFPKLNAGNYSFNARVRTKGNNQWIYLKQPFIFSIDNYWYQTWWFYTLISIASIGILFLLILSYFNRKLERHKNELEKQKAIEDERKRIAKDMHDDLGSGLTKITYLSQMALLNKSNEEHVSSINKTSTELVESMSEIIWVMKDENNSWEELLLFIKRYAVEYATNNGLSVVFDYPDTLLQNELNGEKRRNIFLAIKEVLHNIVKHAKATEVSIKVIQNSKVHIIIQDNGIGMKTEIKSVKIGGNGLKNIQERMNLVKASFSIENNNGTQIHFIIPI